MARAANHERAVSGERYYVPPALYDVIYSDVVADVPFCVAQARAAGGMVLEVACGTGRILIPCREAGVEIDGFDLDPAMVEALRERLAQRGLKAHVVQADMRDFTMPRRYALLMIPFNTFLHNLTQADQLATLRCCREHLEPGGRLLLGVFHPSASKLQEHGGTPHPRKELPHPSGRGTIRITDTGTREPIDQIIRIRRRVEIVDAQGRVTETHDLAFSIRYVFKPEMELLLRAAGFTRFQVQGGYEAPRPPVEGDYLVWTAWRD